MATGMLLARCTSRPAGHRLASTGTTASRIHNVHRRPARLEPASASNQDESEPSTSALSEDSDDLPIEQQMAKRRPKAAKAAKGAAAAAQPAKPFQVISATRDQALGKAPQSQEQQLESVAVSFLGFVFFVILSEGVFLAASGFLSEAADEFARKVVYPAFSPTLAVFLAFSTAYGLWKTRGEAGSSE